MRPAREDDLPLLNSYAYVEGMDAMPAADGITVAVNSEDVPVGFIRIQQEPAPERGEAGGHPNGAEPMVAHVNPVVVYQPWRGFGVGEALTEDALSRFEELRLVSRGSSLAFYQAEGFEPVAWELIAPAVAADCDGCEMRSECNPQPMRKRKDA